MLNKNSHATKWGVSNSLLKKVIWSSVLGNTDPCDHLTIAASFILKLELPCPIVILLLVLTKKIGHRKLVDYPRNDTLLTTE